MLILGVDTAAAKGSIALAQSGVLLATRNTDQQRSHSEWLLPAIHEIMGVGHSLNNIDFLAIDRGPGSFTGLRISLNVVKTLAWSLGKTILAADSLSILAYNASQRIQPSISFKGSGKEQDKVTFASVMNAYKNSVFVAKYEIYKKKIEQVLETKVVPVSDLEDIITSTTWCCGDGYLAYEKFFSTSLKSKLVRDSHLLDYPNAEGLVGLAHLRSNFIRTFEWNSITPLYLKASEAEERVKAHASK